MLIYFQNYDVNEFGCELIVFNLSALLSPFPLTTSHAKCEGEKSMKTL